MTLTNNSIIKFILFLMISLLGTAVITSIWPYFFSGSTPRPHIWLLVCLYLLLYRNLSTGILQSYAIILILSYFSSSPASILWLIILILALIIQMIKSRVFWPDARYFIVMSIGASVAFEVTYFLVSYLDTGHTLPYRGLYRLGEVSLTAAFSAPFYKLFVWVDRLFVDDSFSSIGSVEL